MTVSLVQVMLMAYTCGSIPTKMLSLLEAEIIYLYYPTTLFNSHPTDMKSQFVTDRLPSRNSSQVNPPFQITYVTEFPTAHIIDSSHISYLCCVSLFLPAIFVSTIPVAAPSKTRVCGRALVGIASSNPVEGFGSQSLMTVVSCQVQVSASG